MYRSYKIGEIVGKNNALLILDYIVKSDKNNTKSSYRVQCQICKNDPELFGDAIYDVPVEYLDKEKGKCPCGCSRNPKWSKEQWEVIIKRKALSNNHEFISFLDEVVTQSTKLKLRCNSCGNEWDSCSISNYTKNRGCPSCAKKIRANKRSTSTEEWIYRFRATGLFPENQYDFKRLSSTGRTWEVYCSNCNTVAISDRSNLVAGKVPCQCSSGGGFDVSKDGFFYILEVSALGNVFIKFGITNFPRRRIVTHSKTLNAIGGKILSKRIFKGKGDVVLKIESELKRELDIENQFIDGFRREACSVDNLPLIEQKLDGLIEMREDVVI